MDPRPSVTLLVCLFTLLSANIAAAQEEQEANDDAQEEYVDPLTDILRPLPTGFRLDACRSNDLGAPSPVQISGCDSAHCIRSNGLEICRCIGLESGWIRVRRGATELARLPIAESLMPTTALIAATVDLDDDGDDELVVGGGAFVMCGPLAETWLVAIVELDGSGAPPLTFWTGDFGPDAFTRAPQSRRCALLTTSFHNVDFLDYRFVGRPIFYEANGTLRPATELPLLVLPHPTIREARYGPQGEQNNTGGGPRTWFSLPGAQRLTRDIPLRRAPTLRREITLRAAQEVGVTDDGLRNIDLDVVNGQGDSETLTYNSPDGHYELAHLGDADSDRLFPAGYWPRDVDAFNSRSGRLESHNEQRVPTILWIGSAP